MTKCWCNNLSKSLIFLRVNNNIQYCLILPIDLFLLIFILYFLLTVLFSTVSCASLVTFDAYYGFPKLVFGHVIKGSFTVGSFWDARHYHESEFGPYGIRLSYFLNNHISVGLDANYSSSEIGWEACIMNENPVTGDTTYNWFNYQGTILKYRAIGQFKYHIKVTKHLDFYTGAGIGYDKLISKYKTDNPNEVFTQSGDSFVTVRFNLGLRYYFLKNLGIGAEVGLTGPICSISICSKF